MAISRWSTGRRGGRRGLPPPIYQLTRRRSSRRLRYYILLAMVVGVGYIVLFSTFFNIKEIIVEGNRTLAKEGIVEAVQKVEEKRRWLIFPQRNILFFKAETVKRVIDNPRLENLSINRRLPNTLIIKVIEKQTAAMWRQRDRWYEIDPAGTIISEMNSQTIEQKQGFISLTDSNAVQDIKIGERVILAGDLSLIQRLHRELPSNLGVRFKLYDLNKIAEKQITVYTDEGWQIYFSAITDIDSQLRKLGIFIFDKDKNDAGWRSRIEYIDLRFGATRVYFK